MHRRIRVLMFASGPAFVGVLLIVVAFLYAETVARGIEATGKS